MKNMIMKILSVLLFICIVFTNVVFASNTPIISQPTSTKEQIKEWAKNKNASETYIQSIDIIWEESVAEGVNPTLVASQCALETGFMRSDVFKTNHNTAGIKQTENTYREFATIRDGIKAQVKHLSLYAGHSGNKDSWLYGWCKSVEGLAGKWAEDPEYSKKLLIMMNEIKNVKVKKEKKKEEKKTNVIKKDTKEKDNIKDKLNRNKKKINDRISSIKERFGLRVVNK